MIVHNDRTRSNVYEASSWSNPPGGATDQPRPSLSRSALNRAELSRYARDGADIVFPKPTLLRARCAIETEWKFDSVAEITVALIGNVKSLVN